MTSTERRREARYQRRKQKRAENHYKAYREFDNYDNIVSYNALYQANRKSRRGVMWKASSQHYQMCLLRNIYKTYNALNTQTYKPGGFVEFDLVERGKKRHIRSVHYSERVVQRCLCDNILVPALSHALYYDNSACLKGKGCDWALNRLDVQMRRQYRRAGNSNDWYIVVYDFSKYFDSIRHDVCEGMYRSIFTDERILNLLHMFIYPFGFPFAKESWRRVEKDFDASEYSGISLGLGSQISQITAVAYPTILDNYIKQELNAAEAGRYMDDGVFTMPTREVAVDAERRIVSICKDKLGLDINPKKVIIQKAGQYFRYLKVSHRVTETGKVERKMNRKATTRHRRKLRKLKEKLDAGLVPIEHIRQVHSSFRGYAYQRGGQEAVYNVDALYTKLFGEEPPKCKFDKLKFNKLEKVA